MGDSTAIFGSDRWSLAGRESSVFDEERRPPVESDGQMGNLRLQSGIVGWGSDSSAERESSAAAANRRHLVVRLQVRSASRMGNPWSPSRIAGAFRELTSLGNLRPRLRIAGASGEPVLLGESLAQTGVRRPIGNLRRL